MLVTEVEMLMWNENREERAKMLEWLTRDEKFLFGPTARHSYGFHRVGQEDRGKSTFWYREYIDVQKKGQTGLFIDLRFSMKTFVFPESLVTILHQLGWKVKAIWRERWVDGSVSGKWSAWNERCDSDFPRLWDMKLLRAREEGMKRRSRTSTDVHKLLDRLNDMTSVEVSSHSETPEDALDNPEPRILTNQERLEALLRERDEAERIKREAQEAEYDAHRQALEIEKEEKVRIENEKQKEIQLKERAERLAEIQRVRKMLGENPHLDPSETPDARKRREENVKRQRESDEYRLQNYGAPPDAPSKYHHDKYRKEAVSAPHR